MSFLNLRPDRSKRPARAPLLCRVEPFESRTLLSSTIDVMVLYTPQALADAGSVAAIDARVHRSIADTNLVMAQSGVNASVRLVYEGEIQYTESGVLNTDLSQIQSGTGAFSGVPALRSRYGADLVSLWVGSGDEGGRAFQPDDRNTSRPDYGFNVVQEQYADDNYIFAHETGHNLGGGHDRADASPRNIPYAYGKTFTIGSQVVGDIMSDTERVPYYSNPSVSFRGVAVGNPDNSAQPADNVRVMNQFAPTVAAYEPTIIPDTRGPVAALDAVIVNAPQQTLTVKAQYADDTAVSLASLHTGNLTVTGPNGFSRQALFEGVDLPGDGPQRVATYQVSIAGASADPNAYAFFLAGNQVKDVFGHVATGVWLGAPNTNFPNRAGPRASTALEVGNLSGTTLRFNNVIDSDAPTAFYRFSVSSATQFSARLAGLTANLDEVLVQDRNGDGQVQSSEILAYPARTGTSPESISMTLPAGTYYLWVAPPVDGTRSPYTLTMSAAAPQTAAASGVISGRTFVDSNANGVWNAGELASPGWRIFIDRNNNGVMDPGEVSTLTDSAGNYRFTGLAAGRYLIKIAPRSGWRQTLPTMNWGTWINLSPGQVVGQTNFGEAPVQPAAQQPASISGSVFNDLNGDARSESNEPGLAGFRVYIDANNDGWWEGSEHSTVTDSHGNWTLGNLSAGTYRVRVLPISGWKQTVPATSYLQSVASGRILSGVLFGQKHL